MTGGHSAWRDGDKDSIYYRCRTCSRAIHVSEWGFTVGEPNVADPVGLESVKHFCSIQCLDEYEDLTRDRWSE